MHISDAVRTLDRDLRSVFGGRLRSLVVYGDAGGKHDSPAPTLVVVDGVSGVIYFPAGPDIPRELEAFTGCAAGI